MRVIIMIEKYENLTDAEYAQSCIIDEWWGTPHVEIHRVERQ